MDPFATASVPRASDPFLIEQGSDDEDDGVPDYQDVDDERPHQGQAKRFLPAGAVIDIDDDGR